MEWEIILKITKPNFHLLFVLASVSALAACHSSPRVILLSLLAWASVAEDSPHSRIGLLLRRGLPTRCR